jgi:hypothetical protein
MRREGALIGPCTASHDAAESRVPVEIQGFEIVAPTAELAGQETLITECLAYGSPEQTKKSTGSLKPRRRQSILSLGQGGQAIGTELGRPVRHRTDGYLNNRLVPA